MTSPKSSREILQWQVEKLVDHTPTVRELILRPPQEFNFKAGQFLMLHVPQTDKPALRAYSIASPEQQKDKVQLLFKFIPNGVASTFVWSLKGTETLQITGPFGRVLFQEPPTDQVIFMNTGTGLTQHLCFLTSKAHLYPKTKFRMFFGLRDERDLYFKPELDALTKSLNDFKYDFVLSDPSPSWTGLRGYVQKHLESIPHREIPTSFYLCGNGNMIKETKKLLIETELIDKARVFSEAFD